MKKGQLLKVFENHNTTHSCYTGESNEFYEGGIDSISEMICLISSRPTVLFLRKFKEKR